MPTFFRPTNAFVKNLAAVDIAIAGYQIKKIMRDTICITLRDKLLNFSYVNAESRIRGPRDSAAVE